MVALAKMSNVSKRPKCFFTWTFITICYEYFLIDCRLACLQFLTMSYLACIYQETISPKMMITIAPYNESNKTCMKHGHQTQEQCRFSISTIQIEYDKPINDGDQKCTNKANKRWPLMDMVVSKYEPLQHIDLSLRTASP